MKSIRKVMKNKVAEILQKVERKENDGIKKKPQTSRLVGYLTYNSDYLKTLRKDRRYYEKIIQEYFLQLEYI
jgi:hypothetical protein